MVAIVSIFGLYIATQLETSSFSSCSYGSRQTFLGISAFEPFSFSLFFQPSLEQAILEVLSKLTWNILFKGCPM